MLLFQSLSFLGPGFPSDDIYIEACREFVLVVFQRERPVTWIIVFLSKESVLTRYAKPSLQKSNLASSLRKN